MAGNWRGGSSERPQRKVASPAASQPKMAPVGWRRHAGRGPASALSRVWLRRSTGIVAVIALAAALVWLYLLLKPVRSQLVVDFGRYPSEMVEPGGSVGLSSQQLQAVLPNLSIVELKSGQEGLKSGRSDTAIFFLDAMMLSGANGPFIAHDRSQPDATVLREQPLANGQADPASAAKWLTPVLDEAESRPTLLILDLSQPRVNWRAGILAPFATFEFLEGLRKEIERRSSKSSKLRLAVLTACRPGEQAWSEDGHSRFSHAIIEGLNGAADGAKDSRTDGRVTAIELGRFVCSDIESWVASHRLTSGQHPVWMMVGPDFDLAYASESDIRWPATSSNGAGVLEDLEKAWQRRDSIWAATTNGEAYHRVPLDWQRANYLLQLAEASFRSGEFESARQFLSDAAPSLQRLQAIENSDFEPPVAASAQLATFKEALPASVPAGELDAAVELRSAVQRAVTISPRAFGLVEETVAMADVSRRSAEDSLFTGSLEAGRRQRAAASQAIQTVSEAALHYERASGALERLLAGLPHLARWAAAQPASNHLIETFAITPADRSDADLQNQPLDVVASLLVEAQLLRRAIAELQSGGDASGENASRQLAGLADRAEEATRRMVTVDADLQRGARELLNQSDKTAGRRLVHRQRLEEYLAYPLLEGHTRRRLLEELARVDNALRNSVVAGKDAAKAAKTPGRDFEWQSDAVSQDLAHLAAWQGLWALLVRSLDPNADSESERLWKDNWKVVADQARLEAAQRPSDAETARKAAASLGDLLRIGWKASATEVSTLRTFTGDRASVAHDLFRRDVIARCLPGYDADSIIRSRRRDPALDLIAWNNVRLSLFLARQSLEDFYAGQAEASHWFDAACRSHLESASRAADGATSISSAVSAGVSEIQHLLSERRRVAFSVQADRVVFGSYDRRAADIALTTRGVPPAGTAAIWLEAPPDATGIALASPARAEIVLGAAGAEQMTHVPIDLLRNAPTCELATLPVRFFFRGHTSTDGRTVEVDPCPPARRTVVALPQPEQGTVIVSGTDRRSILFVLDCSRSMMDALPDGTSKMSTAKSILQSQVGELDSTGEGARRIGLVAFGHRMNRDDKQQLWPNPSWPKNDLPASPMLDFQALVPLRSVFDPALFAAQLNRLEYWGMTPLVNSIRFAVGQFPSDEPGTLVVITDGADSALEKGDATLQASTRATLKGLATMLSERRARGMGIEVHIVGFALDDVSKASLKEVFNSTGVPSGGKEFTADNALNLTAALRSAVESRRYSVIAAGRTDGNSFDLGEASTDLPRGEYQLSFPDAVPAPLSIAGGERIVFDLQNGKFVPRKYQWGSAPGHQVTASGDGTEGPNLLVDRGYEFEAGQATVLVSLDREKVFAQRPREVWFEAADAAGRPISGLTWGTAEQYDVPTWRLTFPAPAEQKISITAHWKMTPSDISPARVFTRAEIGKEFTVATSEGPVSLVLKSFGSDAQRPGMLIVRLEPASGRPPAEQQLSLLEKTWAHVDEGPPGAEDFRRLNVQTERTFYVEEGAIEFAFSTGPGFDPTSARVAIVEPAARAAHSSYATLTYSK